MRSRVPLPLGAKFGRLTITGSASGGRRSKYPCVCECGTEVNVTGSNLTRSNTRSCGCLQREEFGRRNSTHGLTETSTYGIWCAMKSRCSNPSIRTFRHYGGRGIKVCDRWQDFNLFLEDMGERPEGLTLDRRDNDKDYTPGNCRWVDRVTQMGNRRTTLKVPIHGRPMTITEIADGLSCTYNQVYWRYRADPEAFRTYVESFIQ